MKQMDLKTIALGPLDQLESKMLNLDQVGCPVIHRFGPGVYIREVKIPADTFAIGHFQKQEHLNVFLQGRVTMLNDDGTTEELTAPMIFTGKPGRKCGYIHEDVVWLNVYATTEMDVEKLEETYLDKSPEWEKANALHTNENIKKIADREDYKKVLAEFGFTEEQARSQTENTEDLIPLPTGNYKIQLAPSRIEGKGFFATADIEPFEIIAPGRIEGKRTPVGRYINHSQEPNAEMFGIQNNIYLRAIRKIRGNKGGYLGDEITTDYRQNLKLIGV